MRKLKSFDEIQEEVSTDKELMKIWGKKELQSNTFMRGARVVLKEALKMKIKSQQKQEDFLVGVECALEWVEKLPKGIYQEEVTKVTQLIEIRDIERDVL